MPRKRPKPGASMESVYRAGGAHVEALKALRLARIAEAEALATLKASVVAALASFQTPPDREQLEALARHYGLLPHEEPR